MNGKKKRDFGCTNLSKLHFHKLQTFYALTRVAMNNLRAFTDNANVIVQFFQSINCLFLQIRWLERNIRHGTNEQIGMVLLLVCLVGYYTLSCSGNDVDTIGYFCGERGVTTLIVLAVVGIIVYFLWKRYQQSSSSDDDTRNGDEQDQLIPATVVPFDQVEMGIPKHYRGSLV